MNDQKFSEKPTLRTDQDNWVRIRVWNSGYSAERNVGHVSLQTKEIYVSFSPDAKASTLGKLQQTGVKGRLNTLNEDIGDMETDTEIKGVAEGRMPDLNFTLYSLNVKAIENAFRDFKEREFKWSVWGSNIVAFKKDKTIRNCSGLVACLLKTGGIESLLPDVFRQIANEQPDGGRIGDMVVGVIGCGGARLLGEKGFGALITPDGIGQIAQMARSEERKKYELTPAVNINVAVNITQNKCVIF